MSMMSTKILQRLKVFACLLTAMATVTLHGSTYPQTVQARPPASPSIVYVNRQYGFRFELPGSWKGYTVITREELAGWSGSAPPANQERYTVISIRHPLWTKEDPHQDIPIMVLTLRQWSLIDQEKMIVSAAPIGPTELGRNSRYVFALPARYNFAFLTGYEEVEKIIEGKPLHAF